MFPLTEDANQRADLLTKVIDGALFYKHLSYLVKDIIYNTCLRFLTVEIRAVVFNTWHTVEHSIQFYSRTYKEYLF